MSNYTRIVYLDSQGQLTDIFELCLTQYRTKRRAAIALRVWMDRIANSPRYHGRQPHTIKVQTGEAQYGHRRADTN